MKIPCLPPDGFVALRSYMQPVPEEAELYDGREVLAQPTHWTGDLEIVRNARVSHDADWRQQEQLIHEATCLALRPPMSNGETRPCNCKPRTVSDPKLIRRLYRDQHTSPFEAMVFTFEVKAPLFVFRQWHRHRTWSYSEVSARYSELPEEYWTPMPDEIGYQDPKNRQARMKENPFNDPSAVDKLFANPELARMEEYHRVDQIAHGFREEAYHAFQRYKARLGEGVPRELARVNLPLGTFSRMFCTVDLHNLFNFLRLRDHDHAQPEIRVYAKALKQLITPIVPESVKAFDEIKWKVITVD